MRIVVISYHYPPDPAVGVFRTSEFTPNLNHHRYDVASGLRVGGLKSLPSSQFGVLSCVDWPGLESRYGAEGEKWRRYTSTHGRHHCIIRSTALFTIILQALMQGFRG